MMPDNKKYELEELSDCFVNATLINEKNEELFKERAVEFSFIEKEMKEIGEDMDDFAMKYPGE